jgi:hypothetical protein
VKLAVQVFGQLIPAGVLMTVPSPVPALFTVSASVALKVAVTVVAAFREMVQVALVPLQPPDHAANLEPDLAAAVSLMDVPSLNFAVHVLPQLTPEGLLVTVPAPLPALLTVSWRVVVAPALEDIPHRARNRIRQQKLPRKDLNLDITPRERSYF